MLELSPRQELGRSLLGSAPESSSLCLQALLLGQAKTWAMRLYPFRTS